MNRYFFPLYPLFFLLTTAAHLAAQTAEQLPDQVSALQAIADEFRARLGITGQVLVEVVSHDKKLVSVRRSSDRKDFVLCFDQTFLSSLSEEEIRAAIAHEFGHIWIFTHHPYLQTEALANQTAIRLVSRDSLEKIYVKVTEFSGKKLVLTSD